MIKRVDAPVEFARIGDGIDLNCFVPVDLKFALLLLDLVMLLLLFDSPPWMDRGKDSCILALREPLPVFLTGLRGQHVVVSRLVLVQKGASVYVSAAAWATGGQTSRQVHGS